MAKTSVDQWDETASNNTDIGGTNIDEGCAPSGINNAIRALMAQLKTWFKSTVFRIWDATDSTKKLAFDLSGLTAGTTRTLTVPDKSGTLAMISDVGSVASKTDVRRNLIVNGSMAASQENGNTLGTTNGYYPADQWALYFTAASAAMSVQRIQARTLANALDQIEFKTTTAKASLAASDSVTLTQNIEGSAFASAGFGTANAKPLVLRAQVTLPAGLYHFHLQNSAGDRHCAVPFTIAAGEANSPVVKEIVVPGDTSGTWLTADGVIGITVDLVLAAGSSKTGGTASTWGATAYFAAATQFNILSSTANVARLADVGFKLDLDATGLFGQYQVREVHPVYRSERYYARYDYATNDQICILQAVTTSVASGVLVGPAPVRPCKTPNITATALSTFSLTNAAGGGAILVNSLSLVGTVTGGVFTASATRNGAGLVAGDATILFANSPAIIVANSRL